MKRVHLIESKNVAESKKVATIKRLKKITNKDFLYLDWGHSKTTEGKADFIIGFYSTHWDGITDIFVLCKDVTEAFEIGLYLGKKASEDLLKIVKCAESTGKIVEILFNIVK